MNEDDTAVTTNYIKGCYAKDTNLTLTLGGNSITYPGTIPALTKFIYYNPLEDNGTNDGEGEHNFTTPITSPISIASLPIENINTSFPPDGKGTTSIEYKLNFDRKLNLVVNPFKMSLNGINIIDEDSVTETGGTVTITDKNATMYYARTRASKFFYEDVTDSDKDTPIAVDVYCDLGFTECDDIGLETYRSQINEMNWWLSLEHNATGGDGNVTLLVGTVTPSGTASVSSPSTTTTTADPANVQITAGGIDTNVNVSATSTNRPMTVEIELVRESDPASLPYTNEWLIYNKNAPTAPSPFYKVEFIGVSGWAGHGDTGNVVESNTSTKKNRRLGW